MTFCVCIFQSKNIVYVPSAVRDFDSKVLVFLLRNIVKWFGLEINDMVIFYKMRGTFWSMFQVYKLKNHVFEACFKFTKWNNTCLHKKHRFNFLQATKGQKNIFPFRKILQKNQWKKFPLRKIEGENFPLKRGKKNTDEYKILWRRSKKSDFSEYFMLKISSMSFGTGKFLTGWRLQQKSVV